MITLIGKLFTNLGKLKINQCHPQYRHDSYTNTNICRIIKTSLDHALQKTAQYEISAIMNISNHH